MNVSRAVELAFASAFRTNAELGNGTSIRCWQSVTADGSIDPEKTDRTFPLVAITCGMPRYNDDQCTLYCDCIILCGTKVDDDKDHLAWSSLYGAVQEVADQLFAGFKGAESAAFDAFKNAVHAECGENFNGIGGLQFVDGLDPYDDSGVNMGGIVVRVHYSRNDY